MNDELFCLFIREADCPVLASDRANCALYNIAFMLVKIQTSDALCRTVCRDSSYHGDMIMVTPDDSTRADRGYLLLGATT